jgi:RNA polymerase sigma-70 factor (ECF subfamily)
MDAPDPDGDLLVATRRDPEAFSPFYERNRFGVTAFFYRRTACAHTAADLTAETFAEALAGVQRFKPAKGTGRGWLYGIAGNQYRQWLRRGRVADGARRRLGMITPTLTTEDIDDIEGLVDLAPAADALAIALRDLTPALRDAVMLRVGRDLPYDQVALTLGCTVNTARVRVSRALAQLEVALEIGA